MASTTLAGSDGQTPRLGTLTTKITTILSSSLANIEIRDSLEALDSRHIQNTSSTRRNLRLDLQAEAIKSNFEIIHDFGNVAGQLRSVGDALSNLQRTVAEMREHVLAAKRETAPMLDEADALLDKQKQVYTKKQLLQAFTAHFVLTESELLVLTSTAEPVNDSFFAVLVKVKRIHKDCQVLLGGENQRLGLEILEQSSKHLTAAFQKLYRWVQREFKSLDLENPQLNVSIRRAVRMLAERPALFQNCLDTFAESRERTLSDAFYGALTGSMASGSEMSRPIEFSMHEPLRYVGDMLAWIHSSAVSERETLEGLFVAEGDEIARGIREGLESEAWSRTAADEAEETFDGRKTLGRLVDRGLAGAAQLLRQRLDQVLQNHDDAVLAYKVSNLIAFYRSIFTRLIESVDLIATLDEMQAAAVLQFQTSMRMNLDLVSSDATVPADLSAPDFLADALAELRALLTSYETSAASLSASEDALTVVLAETLTPYTVLCSSLADTLQPPASAVFIINCLQTTRATLNLFRSFAGSALSDLDAAIASHTAGLRHVLLISMLENSGLTLLDTELRQLNASPDDVAALHSLLALPAFSGDALHEVAQTLDDFLPGAISDAEEHIGRLQDKSLMSTIVREAASEFRVVFDDVVMWLDAADELQEQEREQAGNAGGADGGEEKGLLLRELFPRTSEEVAILFS